MREANKKPPLTTEPTPGGKVVNPDLDYSHRLMSMSNRRSKLMMYSGTLSGREVTILVDAGASENFVDLNLLKEMKLKRKLKHPAGSVRLADGRQATSTHVALLKYQIGTLTDQDSFHTMESLQYDLILGQPWLQRLQPIPHWRSGTLRIKEAKGGVRRAPHEIVGETLHVRKGRNQNHVLVPTDRKATDPGDYLLSAVQLRQLAKWPDENEMYLAVVKAVGKDEEGGTAPDRFQLQCQAVLDKFPVMAEGTTPPFPKERAVDHKIELLEGAKPVKKRAYRLSPLELDELKRQVEDLMKRGYIQPSVSPFGSPVIFVKKKSGEMRLCVDYRALNAITIKNSYPLPKIDELLDKLHGAQVFSKIDLASGYHQIRVAEEDVQKTAFQCQLGHFEYRVLPFGLCNAPSTFQALMNRVLTKEGGASLLDFVIVYLDDILIFSRTEEEHLTHLETVCDRLQKETLYAKRSKCSFGLKEVEFLGHIVSSRGISTDPQKITAVQEWPAPANSTEVAAFLGLANFYRRFVREFSSIAAPLTQLLKKEQTFQWTGETQTAFEKLKAALCSTPVLAPPDRDQPYTIECDASAFAIGAVLYQGEGPTRKVVAYDSRKLNPAERNYLNHDKETLSVVHALRKWRHYVQNGHHTRVFTDNSATKCILSKSTEQLNNRQRNWLAELAEYDCSLWHKAGTENTVADALSRRADYALEYNLQKELQGRPELSTTVELNSISWGGVSTIYSDLLNQVDAEAGGDPAYQQIRKQVEEKSRTDFKLVNSLLYKQDGRLYVPGPPSCSLRTKLLEQAHDAPASGHLGRDKTSERLSRYFYWPRLWEDVAEFVKTCETCQAVKPSNQKKIGLLYPLEAPMGPWESISLDLITDLPPTKQGNTACVTFVDRFSKMIHVWPCKTEVNSQEMVQIFLQAVFRMHGVPKEIVSDRDPRFTAAFWSQLFKRLGTRFNMSSANHPQTDGQSERANRTIEEILRCYVSPHHDDWDEHLATLEFAYNDSLQASTGYTPFFTVYGRHPYSPLSLFYPPSRRVEEAETVSAFADRMQSLYRRVRLAILAAQKRQADFANRSRREHVFKVGDLVWLRSVFRRKHMTVLNARAKFNPNWLGPFAVKRVNSHVSYELEMPEAYKHIHPVVHVSFLREHIGGSDKFPGRTGGVPAPAPELIDEEEHFWVDAFLNHKYTKSGRKSHLLWLVRWKGYGESEDHWVFDADLREDLSASYYSELRSAYEAKVGAVSDKPLVVTPPARVVAAPATTVQQVGVRRSSRVRG